MLRPSAMVRRLLTVVVVAVLGAGLSGCAHVTPAVSKLPTQSASALPAAVTAQIQAAVKRAIPLAGASGAIVGVWAPWSGRDVEAYGTTTRGGSQPMASTMSFRAGTITAAMTCSVLLSLVDAGTVKLSDPVTNYVPGLLGVNGMTLGELCQSTSGIGDFMGQLQAQFVNNPTRQWSTTEILSDGIANGATGQPGGAYSYSNTGYVLLGLALQNATGQSWQSLYKQYVFDRLGMRSSYLPAPDELTIAAAHPQGYATRINQDNSLLCGSIVNDTAQSSSQTFTAGGVVSTAADLAAYSRALASGSLLTQASATAQWKTVSVGGAAGSSQQFGLGGETLGPLRGRTGEAPGSLTSAFTDATTGLTIVVMLNNSTSGAPLVASLTEQLASIAVSASPAAGKTAPSASLPWTEDQAAAAVATAAQCRPS